MANDSMKSRAIALKKLLHSYKPYNSLYRHVFYPVRKISVRWEKRMAAGRISLLDRVDCQSFNGRTRNEGARGIQDVVCNYLPSRIALAKVQYYLKVPSASGLMRCQAS